MDNKKRNLIIVVSIIIFVVVPIAIYIVASLTNKPTPEPDNSVGNQRTEQEITSTIAANKPELVVDDKPVFAIERVERVEQRWYIVTIRNNDDPEGLNAAKVLLYDGGKSDGLSLVLGPGTSFPAEVTQAYDLPGPVAEELNR